MIKGLRVRAEEIVVVDEAEQIENRLEEVVIEGERTGWSRVGVEVQGSYRQQRRVLEGGCGGRSALVH